MKSVPHAPISTAPWRTKEELPLTSENLRALFNNEIPLIRIRNFATPEEVKSMIEAFETVEPTGYFQLPQAHPSHQHARYVGVAQFQYATRPKKDYFDEGAAARKTQKKIFEQSFDGIQRFLDLVRSAWKHPVRVGEEPGFGPYYAGIFRLATLGGPLHCGFGPYTAPNYELLGKVNADVAVNLYLERPTRGGFTTVYNRPWATDRNVSTPEIFMSAESVADAERVTFEPTVGDVVMFNNRNPHEWPPSENLDDGTRRLGLGTFLARLPDESIILYS
jgi:hypothetical protein